MKEPIIVTPPPGYEITAAIREARAAARAAETEVHFTFNGVEIRVDARSEEYTLLRDYFRTMRGYCAGPIGPHPSGRLSSETLANDARIEAEHEARERDRQAERDRRDAERRAAFEAETAGVVFDCIDPAAWAAWAAENDDPYGSGVVHYAEAWARLMQARMAKGYDLETVAEEASHDADMEGITGFMYGCAVGALALLWRHGERLRRWHNLDTQIGKEGEAANESGGVARDAMEPTTTPTRYDKPWIDRDSR